MSPSASRQPPTGPIVLSVLLGLALSVSPLPDALEIARPAWMAMLVVFWTLHRPDAFGLLAAWACGLLLDALQGTFLGQHALALTLTCALVRNFRLRMRVSPLSQQVASVGCLVVVYEFMLMWVDGIAGLPAGGVERFASALSVLLVWPLVTLVAAPVAAPAGGE